MTDLLTTTVTTPDGEFTLIAAHGIVYASGWTTRTDALVALIHPTLRTAPPIAVPAHDPAVAGPAESVVAYYDGDLEALAAVDVRQVSGPFREHAWHMLRTVPAGIPVTYTAYAALAGRPAAVRAAAGACAMNAAALFVPCHRVLRTDGTLGGFRYGLSVKQSLLDRESVVHRPAPAIEALVS